MISDLMRSAGDSERRQWEAKQIPIEWSFERYEPQKRADLCFVISDDEKYDKSFPEHPLTRIRRLARRAERFLMVAEAEPGSKGLLEKIGSSLRIKQDAPQISIYPAVVKMMDPGELTAEVGREMSVDLLMVESKERLGALKNIVEHIEPGAPFVRCSKEWHERQ